MPQTSSMPNKTPSTPTETSGMPTKTPCTPKLNSCCFVATFVANMGTFLRTFYRPKKCGGVQEMTDKK